MKNFRTFRKTAIIAALGLLSAAFAFQSCNEDDVDDPIDDKVSVQTIVFTVVDSETTDAISAVEATVTYADASSEVLTVENGMLTIDVRECPDGDCQAEFTKEGYISTTCDLMIDRSGMGEKDDWASASTVMMTAANETFAVVQGEEKTVEVEGSEASVVFPANCLTENAEIAITELASAADLTSVNEAVVIVEERIPLKTFDFQPDGQQFEEPIAVTFAIPEVADDLLFGSLVDGAWETVPVTKNGDGTGTAMVSHFSQHSLFIDETWTTTEQVIELGPFNGTCGAEFTAELSVEPSNAEDPTLVLTNLYEAIANSYKDVYASYTEVTETSSKGTVKTYGKGPLTWRHEFVICSTADHSGGAGN